MRVFSNRLRPFHLSPLPLERLPRAAAGAPERPAAQSVDRRKPGPAAITAALRTYRDLFAGFFDGAVAPAHAPVPDDPKVRTDNLKASALFIDASIAGACEVRAGDWTAGERPDHAYAFVVGVAFAREPAKGAPGAAWIRGTQADRADLRAAEIAGVLAGYIRGLGFSARAHVADYTQVDLPRLAQRAGVAYARGGRLRAPFLGPLRVAVVTTDYALEPDLPLTDRIPLRDALAHALANLWERRRPQHLGRYPMEKLRHADEPTTLVLHDEIKRVPKRANFFKRAAAGDLGEKLMPLYKIFASKHPYALAMRPFANAMVALQGTREPLERTDFGGDVSDPQRNADAIKALGFYLGADFVGICRAEPWMYYASDEFTGEPIEAYHPYAVAMLIDQGYETMEGASGDDWISGSQSQRAYMRGAEIAGVMAAHLRAMGFSTRVHSNAHSEVVHNGPILMAGLGEVSRIGDTILNPFIGPRSKSIVFTTDFPMAIDRPVDFGLQDFCDQCNKCARECPPNAITFGPKVMFNGYEIWKPDVEKCTRYRVSNPKGSACGRCMKMCPWNTEGLLSHRAATWLAINVPAVRKHLVTLDDKLGHGSRNPVKRWWFDIEVVDGVPMAPRNGTNERELNLANAARAASQKIAIYPPELQPPPGMILSQPFPVDREAGLAANRTAETPAAARLRATSRVDEKPGM
jgi:reductive dehalogenase